ARRILRGELHGLEAAVGGIEIDAVAVELGFVVDHVIESMPYCGARPRPVRHGAIQMTHHGHHSGETAGLGQAERGNPIAAVHRGQEARGSSTRAVRCVAASLRKAATRRLWSPARLPKTMWPGPTPFKGTAVMSGRKRP